MFLRHSGMEYAKQALPDIRTKRCTSAGRYEKLRRIVFTLSNKFACMQPG